jgi:hypothetical protein
VIISIAVVGVVVVVVGGIFLRKAFQPVAADDVFALHVLTGVPASSLTDRLFAAYLSRSRRHRTAWSVAGWGSGLVLAACLSTNERVGIGTGAHQPFYADVLLMGFGGYLLGAIVSELHHLRRPRTGARTASLTPRRVASYRERGQQIFLRSVVGLSAAVLVIGLVLDQSQHKPVWQDIGDGTRFMTPSPTPNSYAVPLIATAVVIFVVWLIIEAAQRAVVRRPRPAMPDDLALGDDAIRVTSVEVLTMGGSGLLALLTSYEAGIVNNGIHANGWEIFFGVIAIVGFFFSIGVAIRTRRLAWPRRQIEKDGVRA